MRKILIGVIVTAFLMSIGIEVFAEVTETTPATYTPKTAGNVKVIEIEQNLKSTVPVPRDKIISNLKAVKKQKAEIESQLSQWEKLMLEWNKGFPADAISPAEVTP